jgi:hypothetical protein
MYYYQYVLEIKIIAHFIKFKGKCSKYQKHKICPQIDILFIVNIFMNLKNL